MMIDNTTKTRALFEINKGTNKNPALDVNARMPPGDRRIPFANMIYIADGPSDIPCFSVVKERGGKAYAVYNPERPDEFRQNDELRRAGRIDHYGKADYREDSETYDWLGCRSRRSPTASSTNARRRWPKASAARRATERDPRGGGRAPQRASRRSRPTFLE